MSNLRKKVAKHQQNRRLAALNMLGTPVASDNEDSEDSDHSSVIGDAIIPNLSQSVIEEELRLCVDDIGEKRASSREVALSRLVRLLSHFYCGSFFDSHPNSKTALLELLLRSVRKPSNTHECMLALKAVALVMVNEGQLEQEDEDLYSLVAPTLKNIIQDNTSPIQVKCQSIDTLAMITFSSASASSVQGGLDYFYKILVSKGSVTTTVVATSDDVLTSDQDEEQDEQELSAHDVQLLLVSTLHAYGLLYASVYGHDRGLKEEAWDEWQSAMPAHLDLLESASKDVRVAAGKNVALMYECSHTFKKLDTFTDEDEDNQNTGLVVDEELSEYEELDDLIDILKRLSTESSRRVNKQDRKTQKSAFRDILKSIEQGEKPKEKLKLGRQRLVFRGWGTV
ncbi:MAG: interferon-related developmental regulator-domain-containing protein [Benjaminiella poitrasii]|nr:MAG: interferon-related developmental regulator-domain-containing protein [Benjaminiella poitrasii]